MAEVFNEIPFNGYTYRDEFPVSVRKDGDPFEERRTALADISRRLYTLTYGRTNAERQVIDAFFRARGWSVESFYVADPRDDDLADVSIGTGDGSTTTFSLPTTGENQRHFPADSADVVVKVSGSPVTVSSIDTDARTVTLAAPPAGSAPVTFSGPAYRLVRLSDTGLSWQQSAANWFTASCELIEIIRAA